MRILHFYAKLFLLEIISFPANLHHLSFPWPRPQMPLCHSKTTHAHKHNVWYSVFLFGSKKNWWSNFENSLDSPLPLRAICTRNFSGAICPIRKVSRRKYELFQTTYEVWILVCGRCWQTFLLMVHTGLM